MRGPVLRDARSSILASLVFASLFSHGAGRIVTVQSPRVIDFPVVEEGQLRRDS